MERGDVIGIVEAAYQVERADDAWLRGLMGAARTVLGDSFGILSYIYDASDVEKFRVEAFVSQDVSNDFARAAKADIASTHPDYIRRSFRSVPCGCSSDVPGWRQQPGVSRAAEAFGLRDFLTINGIAPDGRGCAVTAVFHGDVKLTARWRNMLTKISCHLAAAHRLRRLLRHQTAGVDTPDAILSGDGKVHHAQGDASSNSALSRLRDSARAMGRARGPLRISQPQRALDEWKGLIAARWSLIETCEAGDEKFLIARENRPVGRGDVSLTPREREVLGLAAMGQNNKLISYSLGVSHSTVRVLIARAARKLGAHSRGELLRFLGESG